MVFDHGYHGMLDVLLVLAQLGRHLLFELLGKRLDDHVGVGKLLNSHKISLKLKQPINQLYLTNPYLSV